jgi:hypothetical protein
MVLWSKTAKFCRQLQPDPAKVTLAIQRKATQMAIDDGCIPKPKGGGGGIHMKELSSYYKTAQKTTGKLFKDLY